VETFVVFSEVKSDDGQVIDSDIEKLEV